MASLIVVLRRGFLHDEVTIQVNGEMVFVEDEVTTLLLKDRATSFQTEVPTGRVTLEVLVPSRALSQTFVFEIANILYVNLSLVENGSYLESSTSDRPFASI